MVDGRWSMVAGTMAQVRKLYDVILSAVEGSLFEVTT